MVTAGKASVIASQLVLRTIGVFLTGALLKSNEARLTTILAAAGNVTAREGVARREEIRLGSRFRSDDVIDLIVEVGEGRPWRPRLSLL